ncbi:MAG: enoyl-CoA hydratase-related protein [Bacteroidia bacterium]|nr:enoyl-CoA hydratase-related protein [Bacteroidia bacterium]
MSEQQYANGQLRVNVDATVKTITLYQPEKKNAINADMAHALLSVMKESAQDDCRVIILTGAAKDFCAGADLDPRALAGAGIDVASFLKETYNPLILAMRGMDKPIIAKVRGVCVGIGWNFALGCDLIYATPNARFSQIFTRIGLSSDGGGSYFLWERLGHQRAFEMLAFHEQISGEQALEMNLVNGLFPEETIDELVKEKADLLANGPYLAIQRSKSNLRSAQNFGLEAALTQEADNQGKNFISMDFMEGISAFLQKRAAKFRGK